MSKLQLNDDGTATLPLLGDTMHELVIPEPSLDALGRAMEIAERADEKLPVPTLRDNATQAQVEEMGRSLRERSTKLYTEAPYAHALVEVVQLFTGVELTLAQLPAWAANPATLRELLTHFQTPLVG